MNIKHSKRYLKKINTMNSMTKQLYLNQSAIIKQNEKIIKGNNKVTQSSFLYHDYWIDCLYIKDKDRLVFSNIYKKGLKENKDKYKLSEILSCQIHESQHFSHRFRQRVAFFLYNYRKKMLLSKLNKGSLFFNRKKGDVFYYKIVVKGLVIPLEFYPQEELVILQSIWKKK